MVIFAIALLIIIGIYSTKISHRLGIPVLLFFLGMGMLFGSDVLNLIYFDNAQMTQQVANIALIFILFEGGYNIKHSSIKKAIGPSVVLATFGIVVTALSLGLLIHWILDFELVYSFLIGSILSSTDAAAVINILRKKAIVPDVSSTLQVESAANDPFAIMMTLLMIELLIGQTNHPLTFSLSLLWQLGGGIIIGLLVGMLGKILFNHLKTDNRGYYYVLIIGVCLLSYGSADLFKASGIIAVFFTGFWMGNSEFIYKKGVSHFMEGISTFSNMALFLLLGLLVFPKQFASVWWQGLIIAVLLILVARPIAVFLSTIFFKFKMKERLFIAWGGVKGAVPIVLATYPAVYGIDPNHLIFNIVFFAVLLSCIMQGATLNLLAKWLGLLLPPKLKSLYSMELLTMKKTDIDMFEFHIEEHSQFDGYKIKDLGLPEGVLITSLVRGKSILTPKGDTEIKKGDILFILSPIKEVDAINELLN